MKGGGVGTAAGSNRHGAPFRLEIQPRERGEARCLECGEMLTVIDMESGYCGLLDTTRCRLDCEWREER